MNAQRQLLASDFSLTNEVTPAKLGRRTGTSNSPRIEGFRGLSQIGVYTIALNFTEINKGRSPLAYDRVDKNLVYH